MRGGRHDARSPCRSSSSLALDALAWVGDFVTGLMTSWPEFPFTFGGVDSEHPNRFPVMDTTAADGKRTAALWERFNGVRARFPL